MHQTGQFEEDYCKAVERLDQAMRNSRIISQTVEKKLNEEELEDLMAVLRELMPTTIKNLTEVYRFIKKYESTCHAAEITKDDLCQEKTKTK
jgi:hypothetical protein